MIFKVPPKSSLTWSLLLIVFTLGVIGNRDLVAALLRSSAVDSAGRRDAESGATDQQSELFKRLTLELMNDLKAARATLAELERCQLSDDEVFVLANCRSALNELQHSRDKDWPRIPLANLENSAENSALGLHLAFANYHRFCVDETKRPDLELVVQQLAIVDEVPVELLEVAKTFEVLSRLFILQEERGSPEVTRLIAWLEQNSSEDSPGQIGLLSFEAVQKGVSELKRIELFTRARGIAERNNLRAAAWACQRRKVISLMRLGLSDRALLGERECLQLAREFGSDSLVFRSLAMMARIECKLLRFESANEHLELAEACRAYESLSPLEIRVHHHLRASVAQALGNRIAEAMHFSVAGEIGPLLADQKVKSLAAAGRAKFQANQLANVKNLKLENSKLTKQKLLADAVADEATARAQMVVVGASLLSLLLISWVVFLLAQKHLKSKLSDVETDLENERQHVLVSERKCSELSTKVAQLQKMESLGLLAGGVAHDLNNVLVGVIGNAEIMLMKDDFSDRQFMLESIDRIIVSAEKAADLSRQMLSYAGKQLVEKQPTNLTQLVKDYRPVLDSSCTAKQQLTYDGQTDVNVKVDRVQIERVLLNLVVNASQASGPDGRITIQTYSQVIANVDEMPNVFGSQSSPGEYCVIEVADEGAGIAPETQELIFDPFYSGRGAGRGLGLAVVYGTVSAHDGFVQCLSGVGKGTTFRVFLPMTTEKVPPACVPSPAVPLETPGSRKVLIVDDEETVLDACSQMVALDGYAVSVARGGLEGLKQILEHGDEFDCVLLDIVMPDLGANELLMKLEEAGIQIPIILFTGFSQTKLDFFYKRANVVKIIEKPFHAAEIRSAISQAINERTFATVE